MKKTRKLAALILSVVLLAAFAVQASADYDYTAHAKIINSDFSGKTVILHSNDVHGDLMGYSYIPALKAQFEAAGAEVILVDAGDFSQGSIYVSLSKGASAVTMMNAVGYDLVTIGNHEFDYGYDQLIRNMEQADFKVLCADIYLDKTGETIFDPTAVIEMKSGLKLGFFGLDTPETATKVNPGMIQEISFAAFDDLYASAQIAVDSLKEQNADLIIGVIHLGVDEESAPNGYRSLDLYDNVPGIDFLIDGHSHTVMTAGENGEPIQSAGTAFANIGVVVIDDETKTITDNFLMSTLGLPRDETIAATAQSIIDTVDSEYAIPFAKSEVFLNGEREPGNRTEETNLGNLVTDAIVWSVISGLGDTDYFEDTPIVGVINGGAIRASIGKGDVTRRDINTALPFGNTVAVVFVTGRELLEVLEASTYCAPEALGGFPQTCGIEWTLDTTVPFDQGDLYMFGDKESSYYAPASIRRVSITAVNGEPFNEDAVYAVVTNNFCAVGGDTYNAFGSAYSRGFGFDTGIPLDDALISYISEVLGDVIGEDYAEPRGMIRQILP